MSVLRFLGGSMWRPMQDSSLCHQRCNETCECPEFSPDNATRCTGTIIVDNITAEATEPPGGEDGSRIIFPIIGALSFVFFVIIVTICICACRKMCCFNCEKKKRDDEPAPSEG